MALPEIVKLHDQGLVSRLGTIADGFERIAALQTEKEVASHYHWKAEGIRESIREILRGVL